MTKKIYHFFIIAAVNSAAFFLYANEKPRSIFVQGKTEIIEINDLNSSRVITLSENYSINYNDLVCGSICGASSWILTYPIDLLKDYIITKKPRFFFSIKLLIFIFSEIFFFLYT